MSKSELLRVGVGGYGIYLLTSAFIAIPPMAKVFRNGLSGEHFLGLAEVLAIGLAGAALVSLAPVFEKWGEDPTDGITGNSDSFQIPGIDCAFCSAGPFHSLQSSYF